MNEINLVENYFNSKYPDKRYRLKNYYKIGNILDVMKKVSM